MDSLNSLNIVAVISKRIKTLAVLVFAAAVISFGFSFLLKEKYKSTAVVYPVNMYQNSEESNSEQLLQYLLSEDVKDELAREFNLYEKYGIDTVSRKGGRALFSYVYQENVSISPTLYESIEIAVKDGDPAFAQKLNARLIVLTNQLIQRNKMHVIQQYLGNARTVLKATDHEMDSLDNEIKKIKNEYNIIDGKQQAKYLSKEAIKGNLSETQLKQSQGLKKNGEALKILSGKIKANLRGYGEMKVAYDKYLMDAQGNVDFILYVSKPSLPDKRCYPVRWIIVLVSSMSALLLGIVVILIKNREKIV
ncbi:MAG: hypothetical protein H0W61_00910 [Bacteroidetes bacterium]|nr:hypothetical protein [Bacteroidota bacterium]